MQLTVERRIARPNPISQWAVLTGRIVTQMWTQGEIMFTVIIAIVLTVGLYVPMRFMMGTVQNVQYGQYVVAIILLQALGMGMGVTGQMAAEEAAGNFTDRLKAMPIPPMAIVLSRIAAGGVRAVISIVVVVSLGYLIGFRLSAGLVQTLFFGLFALTIGVGLTLLATAVGTSIANPAAMSQITTLPTMLLGITSTGFMPESGFPSWLRGFARNQPISQWAQTLRDTAGGGASLHSATASVVWIGAVILIAGPLAVWGIGRRQ